MSEELPPQWRRIALGELATKIGSGATPRGGRDAYHVNGVPLIRSMNVHFDGFRRDGLVFLDDAQARLLSGVEVAEHDVLLNITGASIGRVTLAPADMAGARVNQHVCIIRTKGILLPEYLAARLAAPDLQQWVKGENYGVTRQALTKEMLVRLEIDVPPLAEQRRIVARIEALFARTRQARADLLRIAPLREKSRAAILRSAFCGDLSQDLRAAPTADDDSGPWTIPDTWAWRRVEQVGRVGLGRQRSPANHAGPCMRPYVRAANITWDGWDFSDVKEMNFAEPDFSRFRLEPGDVLLNEGSGSAREVGKPAIWRGEIADCCFQNTLLRVQPRECTSDYLYFCFLDAALSGRFANETQGVNIHHIGKEGLAALAIPVPPRDEQAAIVQRLRLALDKQDRAEREGARALALLDHLERSILTRAFRGELVPQDPADEPASASLYSLRAEPASSVKRRGRRSA